MAFRLWDTVDVFSLNAGTEIKDPVYFLGSKSLGKILWRKNCHFPFYSITVGQEISFADFYLLGSQIEESKDCGRVIAP